MLIYFGSVSYFFGRVYRCIGVCRHLCYRCIGVCPVLFFDYVIGVLVDVDFLCVLYGARWSGWFSAQRCQTQGVNFGPPPGGRQGLNEKPPYRNNFPPNTT